MKLSIGYVLTATLAVGAAARSHGHLHRHVKKNEVGQSQSNVPPTNSVEVVTATAVAYKLDGSAISKAEAEDCLGQETCKEVSEATSAHQPAKDATSLSSQHENSSEGQPNPVDDQNDTPLDMKDQGKDHSPPAKVEPHDTANQNHVETASNEPGPELPPPENANQDKDHVDNSEPGNGGSSDESRKGKDASSKPPPYSSGDFPDGNVSCSVFPSEYGAVSKSRLNLDGWVGIQSVGNIFSPDFQIESGTHFKQTQEADSPCKSGTLCSYACPDGMDKAQWPSAQPKDGQSAGGMYCDDKSMLHRTNKDKPLCEAGEGGVSLQNDVQGKTVTTCRTDYPGTEAMILDTTADAGQTVELFNPLHTRYMWNKMTTSAQYYVNNPGVPVEQACNWGKKDGNVGNWAPMIIGTGVSEQGLTFGSLALNEENGQLVQGKLECNVEVLIDGEVQCRYDSTTKVISEKKGAEFVPTDKGCTVTAQRGQKTVYRFHG